MFDPWEGIFLITSSIQNVEDGSWNVVGKQLMAQKMFNSRVRLLSILQVMSTLLYISKNGRQAPLPILCS